MSNNQFQVFNPSPSLLNPTGYSSANGTGITGPQGAQGPVGPQGSGVSGASLSLSSLISATGVFSNLLASTGTFSNLFFTSASGTSLAIGTLTGGSAAFTSLTLNGQAINAANSTGSFISLYASTGSFNTLITTGSGTFAQLYGAVNTLDDSNGNLIANTLSARTGASLPSLTGTSLAYGTGTFTTLLANSGTFTTLLANSGTFTTLLANSGTFSSLYSTTAGFNSVISSTGSFTQLNATGANINALTGAVSTHTSVIGATGLFVNLISGSGTFTQLNATGAYFYGLSGATSTHTTYIGGTGLFINLISGSGTFTQLNSTGASINSITGSSLTYTSVRAGTGAFTSLTSTSGTFTTVNANSILLNGVPVSTAQSSTFSSLTAGTGTFTSLFAGTGVFTSTVQAQSLSLTGAASASSFSALQNVVAANQKIALTYDPTLGCQVYDLVNGANWLLQGNTTAGSVHTINTILDDGSGHMSVSPGTASPSKLSLYGGIANPTGFFYGFGAYNGAVQYNSQNAHTWFTQATPTGAQTQLMNLSQSGALTTKSGTTLDDGLGNQTLSGSLFLGGSGIFSQSSQGTSIDPVFGNVKFKPGAASTAASWQVVGATGTANLSVYNAGIVQTSHSTLDHGSGNLTINGTGTLYPLQVNTSSQNLLTNFLAPNMVVNGITQFLFGRTNANNDAATLLYTNVAGGPGTSNTVALRLQNNSKQITLDGNGKLYTTNSVLDDGSGNLTAPGTGTFGQLRVGTGSFTSLSASGVAFGTGSFAALTGTSLSIANLSSTSISGNTLALTGSATASQATVGSLNVQFAGAFQTLNIAASTNSAPGLTGSSAGDTIFQQLFSSSNSAMRFGFANGTIPALNLLPGNVVSTANSTLDNGLGITIYNTSSVGPPATGTRSQGTRLVLNPSLTGTYLDYALGVDNGSMWSSVPSGASSWYWYSGGSGASPVASLLGNGNFSASQLVSGSGVIATGNLSTSANLVFNSGSGTIQAPSKTLTLPSASGQLALVSQLVPNNFNVFTVTFAAASTNWSFTSMASSSGTNIGLSGTSIVLQPGTYDVSASYFNIGVASLSQTTIQTGSTSGSFNVLGSLKTQSFFNSSGSNQPASMSSEGVVIVSTASSFSLQFGASVGTIVASSSGSVYIRQIA